MITRDRIGELARAYQTTEANVRREYLQHVFLSSFYQQPSTDRVYFKGGTAIRMIYRSPRFSEDLDFSTTLGDPTRIEEAMRETVRAVGREGGEAQLAVASQTSGGYVARVAFRLFEQEIAVLLHVSLREGGKRGEVTTIAGDFIPSFIVLQLSQDQLIDEKLQALLARRKARDFYDLYFILRSNLLPARKRGIVSRVRTALKETDVNFESELKQFLPRSHWAVVRDFRETLEREIKRFM
jgi:predicted nucleotidyltransferase component of viral defense system